MTWLPQQIRFCRSYDGTRIAYAVHGSGPPLVKASNWLTHLEIDWGSPVWRHWLEDLPRGRAMIRYDERGCGLSDRDVDDLSLDAWVGDLEAVVDAAALDRFALIGISQGGPIAIAYAVRHPGRVSHLILYGSYARGRLRRQPSPQEREEAEVLLSLIRVGWGRPNPAFRRVFTTLFLPHATPGQMEWFDELQRVSTSAEMAVRIRRARNDLDVTAVAEQVAVPTLVAHCRGDAVVPFAEGRLLATLIRGARFLPLDSENHILLADEPAWPTLCDAVADFLGPGGPPRPQPTTDLSPREVEVLDLVAAGLTNDEIAARLRLSVRTVERHLSNLYAKLGLSGKAARAAAAVRYADPAWRRGAP